MTRKTQKRILASELREGYSVKAPGAPGFSTIRSVEDLTSTTECIRVQLDWGAMDYQPEEEVWIEAVSLV